MKKTSKPAAKKLRKKPVAKKSSSSKPKRKAESGSELLAIIKRMATTKATLYTTNASSLTDSYNWLTPLTSFLKMVKRIADYVVPATEPPPQAADEIRE